MLLWLWACNIFQTLKHVFVAYQLVTAQKPCQLFEVQNQGCAHTAISGQLQNKIDDFGCFPVDFEQRRF